jgi:hypothetical protein
MKTSYQENLTLTVLHLESFYNYRTPGPNFEFKSSILSHSDVCQKIEISKTGIKPNTYSVIDEIKCANTNSHYANIHSKKQRICAAFTQLKIENKDQDICEEFLNNDFSVNELETTTSLREKPEFCRNELNRSAKKSACVECDSICAFT